ncbi:MAG TPA: dephospho-CoA kinase [Polyangiaceae bacterium]
MHVFGITGGIASGKSTVSARFRARGLPVIAADQLARDAVAKGSEGLAAVVEAFGSGVLAADGSLDRKALAAIVFVDDAKRRLLNGLVHPRVAMLGALATQELAAKGEPLAAYEAALLVENGLADAFRPLVVVAASEATQLARTKQRDGATDAEALARVRAQMPLTTKIAAADVVLENDGTEAELLRHADEALDEVCARTGVDPQRYPRPA